MKKKPDHRAEVAALAVVVRTVLDDMAARGRAAAEPTCAALAAVEAWVAGADLDAAALQAAANRSHEDGVPFAQREPDRARAWAGTAAGNLAWMATKARGWQSGGDTILDAASYALSSLKIDGVMDRDQLDAVRVAALAKVGPSPRPAKRVAKPKPRSTNLAAFIGAAANRRLAKRKPVFDLAQRGSDEQLRAILAERRYPAHAALFAFEERYGGLVAADAPGAEGEDWIFGAHACLASDAHADPRGDDPSWVPVAYSPNDCIFYLDERGVAWAIDTIGDVVATRFADDGDAMVARIFMEA